MAKILLMDDDEINLAMMRHALLERVDAEVAMRLHPDDALRLLAREPFDFLIIDQNMPSMSGTDVIRAIRSGQHGELSLQLNQVVPILFNSGDDGYRNFVQFAQWAPIEFICKTTEWQKYIEIMRRYVDLPSVDVRDVLPVFPPEREP